MKSCGMYPPWGLEKFLTSFLSSGSKVVECTPQCWHLVEIWENLLFHVLSNDACKFAINLFPITWGPFENGNSLYFLLKIQIWNGCDVLNIAGNPIKDINVNLSFLSSRWKLWNVPPLGIGKIFNFISEFRIKSCGMYPPDRWHLVLHCSAFIGMTIVTSHFCFQLWWVCTAINFGSNLGYFLAVKQVGTVLYLCILEFLAVKQVGTVWKFLKCISEYRIRGCWIDPPKIGKIFNYISEFRNQKLWNVPPQCWHLVEIWKNLLFHVLSNDACKFAINLSPITWGPFENVNLLYFLLKIQIWNGCNVLDIAGNPIKDINVDLHISEFKMKSCGMYPTRIGKKFNCISELRI